MVAQPVSQLIRCPSEGILTSNGESVLTGGAPSCLSVCPRDRLGCAEWSGCGCRCGVGSWVEHPTCTNLPCTAFRRVEGGRISQLTYRNRNPQRVRNAQMGKNTSRHVKEMRCCVAGGGGRQAAGGRLSAVSGEDRRDRKKGRQGGRRGAARRGLARSGKAENDERVIADGNGGRRRNIKKSRFTG